MKNYKCEIKEINVLEDLGENVENLLRDELILKDVKDMVYNKIFKNLIFYHNENNSSYESTHMHVLYKDDLEIKKDRLSKEDNLDTSYSVRRNSPYPYCIGTDKSLIPILSNQLKKIGIDYYSLDKNTQNKLYLIYVNHITSYFEEDIMENRLIHNLYTPIFIDEDKGLLVIGVYKVSHKISTKQIKGQADYSQVFNYENLIVEPSMAFIYSTKYNIRMFDINIATDKYAQKIFLPHNISSDVKQKEFVRGAAYSTVRDLMIMNDDEEDLFLNHKLTKSLLNEISKRYIKPDDIYNKTYNVIDEDIAQNNPEEILKDYSLYSLPITIGQLSKPTKKSGKTIITKKNLTDFFSITDEDLVKNMSEYIENIYSTAILYKTNNTIICSQCGNITEIIDDDDIKGYITCDTCEEKYILLNDFRYSIILDENRDPNNSYKINREHEIIIHGKFRDSWINKEVDCIELELDVDEVDPLHATRYSKALNRDYTSFTAFGNSIDMNKKGFVNDAAIINNKLHRISRIFDLQFYVPYNILSKHQLKQNFIKLRATKSLVSFEGEQYFQTRINHHPEKNQVDVGLYEKILPSKVENCNINNLFCLNKKETEMIHKSQDKYDVLSHYVDIMGFEVGSNQYYASMALVEGVYASYIKTFPKLEALIKSNFKDVAKEIFETSLPKREIRRIFNMKANRPKDICKLNDVNISIPLKKDYKWSLNEIKRINYITYLSEFCKIKPGNINSYTLDMISIWENEIDNLRTAINKVVETFEESDYLNKDTLTASKCVEYAGRAIDAQAIYTIDFKDLWPDYIYMAEAINYDLNKEAILFPDSLKREHDIASRSYNLVSNEIEAKEFKKKVNSHEYKQLEYVDDELGYQIIAPKEISDIVEEGNQLRHCVGSYARRINENKKLKIFFLRDLRKPEQSLITVEVYGKYVRQARGYSNNHINAFTKEHDFLKKWMKEKNLIAQY